MRLVGLALMAGGTIFAYLYDTGKWPAFWAAFLYGGAPNQYVPGQQSSGLNSLGALGDILNGAIGQVGG